MAAARGVCARGDRVAARRADDEYCNYHAVYEILISANISFERTKSQRHGTKCNYWKRTPLWVAICSGYFGRFFCPKGAAVSQPASGCGVISGGANEPPHRRTDEEAIA